MCLVPARMHIQCHRLAKSCTELHIVAQSCTDLQRVAQSCTDLHRLAQSCTELHRVAPIAQMFPPRRAQHVHSPPGFHMMTITTIVHAWAMPYLMQICPKTLEQTEPQPKDPLDAPAHTRTSVLHIRHHPTCTNHFSSWQPKEKQKKTERPTNISPPT